MYYSNQFTPAANKKCCKIGVTFSCDRSVNNSSNSSWVVQLTIRFARKEKMPAAIIDRISRLSKPKIRSQT